MQCANVTSSQSFATFLRDELDRRCKKNPRYSLRAFARSLGMESSHLSKVLRGQRPVTETLFSRLEGPLNLDPVSIHRYKEELNNQALRKGAAGYEILSVDVFRTIADWWHYAIIELTILDKFQSDRQWIAQILDVPEAEIRMAVDRLLRMGLLREEANGNLVKGATGFTNIRGEESPSAFRKRQRAILENAIEAMEKTPRPKRDQSSMTMAVNSHRLGEAKRRISNFRRKLCKYLQGEGPLDSVYHLSISLYPVAEITEEE